MIIESLDRKIVELSPCIGKETFNAIQNAYYLYALTNSKTGLVELAVILGETDNGWLPHVAGKSCRNSLSQLFDLINLLKETDCENFVDKLHRFRMIRNKIKTSTPIKKEEFEEAFVIFLEFAEWYYTKYHGVKSIYDDSHYKRVLQKGEYIAERFRVIEHLGGSDTHKTYKVQDDESSREKYFVAKIPFVLHGRFKSFLHNEKKNRVLCHEHPNIVRYYSSHPISPRGEVLIYEYIEGKNLMEWANSRKADDKFLADFLYIIGSVLNGLESIHRRNLTHGYIQPSNIIITSNDTVKISGFEYCEAVGVPFDTYEAFFQKNNCYSDSKLKERRKDMDIYALGAIMRQILGVRLIPGAVSSFIEKACSSNASNRYYDAIAMKEEWGQIYKHVRYNNPEYIVKSRKIALISCSRRKKAYPCSARELYSESERFVNALHYVESPENGYDRNYIVSGRYGLVNLDSFLPPYDCDLREFPLSAQAAWARFIVQLLIREGVSEECIVVVHADDLYKTLLISALLERDIQVEEGVY